MAADQYVARINGMRRQWVSASQDSKSCVEVLHMKKPHWLDRSQLKPSLNRVLSTKSDGATKEATLSVA